MKNLEAIHVPRNMLLQLAEAAAAHRLQEVCGLIGGHRRRSRIIAKDFYLIDNIAMQPDKTFRLDEQQQINALYEMARQSLELVAIFHSHPTGPNWPSQTDIAMNAHPSVIYLIAFPTSVEANLGQSHLWMTTDIVIGAWKLKSSARPIQLIEA